MGTAHRSAALITVTRGWEFVDGPTECQHLNVCFIIRVVDGSKL